MRESLNLQAADYLESAAELHRLAAEFSALGNKSAGSKYTALAHTEALRAIEVSTSAKDECDETQIFHARVA